MRSASGEHTLVVTPIAETPWLLTIDVPTRRLGESPGILLHKSWPLAALLLVSTLTLLRSLNLHLSRLNEELTTQLKTEQGAHLPPLMQEIGEQVGGLRGQPARLLRKTSVCCGYLKRTVTSWPCYVKAPRVWFRR